MNQKYKYRWPLLATILFLFVPVTVCAQRIVPDSLLDRKWDKVIKFATPTAGGDSLLHVDGLTYYFNTDSVCHLIATKDVKQHLEELHHYYLMVDYSKSRGKQMYQELVKAKERSKNPAFDVELEICSAYMIIWPPIKADAWEYGLKLLKKYEQKGDMLTQLRIMHRMFYAGKGALVNPLPDEHPEIERVPMIEFMNHILSVLDNYDGNSSLFDTGSLYVDIAMIYYSCKYYDRAIPLFRKATEQPRITRSTLVALDYLGDYYSREGEYDRSDSLYFSLLECPQNVLDRPIFDVIALGAIAANARLRGNPDEAIRLYSAALPRALEERDSTLAGGYALNLGRLYMEKGEMKKTNELIAQARRYLIAGGQPIRNWERFYTLNRDCCLMNENTALATFYIDSIKSIKEEEDQIFNTRQLAFAEQQAFEKEKILKEEQLSQAKSRAIVIAVILFITVALLVLLWSYYRRLQARHRELFLQIKARDAEAVDEITAREKEKPLSDNIRYQELFLHVRTFLLTDRTYANPNIDADLLISEMQTNRKYLFDAVKTFTGKTLQEYLNSLRLEEAKKLLDNTDMVIEQISMTCGFNNSRTFYRLFKSTYGISPAIYRKMSRETR